MAGTWQTQSKRRPGAYINVKGAKKDESVSPLGRLLLFSDEQLDWGAKGAVELSSDTDFRATLGTTLDDPRLTPVREALKGAQTVIFVNLNSGTKATGDAGFWNIEAKHPGTKGNQIVVTIEPDPGDTKQATVTTTFENIQVDSQVITIDTYKMIENNSFVTFTPKESVEGTEFKTKTTTLAGGTTTKATAESLYASELENNTYAVVTTAGYSSESNMHSLIVSAVKRLREQEGIKVRAVVPKTNSKWDYEGVSVVRNGYVLANGETVTNTVATARYAGLAASTTGATSLTYTQLEDAVSAYPKLTNDNTIQALNNGEIVFTTRPGQRVVIEQDINSLTTFTSDKPKLFAKNKIIRTLDAICEDTSNVFETSFIGKVPNNDYGRNLFKANRVTYLQNLQNQNMIQDFDSEEDIVVKPGNDSDSIVCDLAITPVDAIEKLYMTIVVS